MLEILQVDGPVVAFRAEGTLTRDDYDRMTQAIDDRLHAHEHVGLFADLSALSGLSLGALQRDLQYSLRHLGELHRFARVAVLSEKAWLRAWSQLAWLLVPKSTVRAFEVSEWDAALAWTRELSDEPARRALRIIPTTRPDTYAFSWNGTIGDDDVNDVLERLERALESHISVRLLARIEHAGGIRPHALLRSTLARLKALGLRKVERYAVVSRPGWLSRYAQVAGELTGMQIRHFALEQEAEAWAWLEAEPVRAEPEPPSASAAASS